MPAPIVIAKSSCLSASIHRVLACALVGWCSLAAPSRTSAQDAPEPPLPVQKGDAAREAAAAIQAPRYVQPPPLPPPPSGSPIPAQPDSGKAFPAASPGAAVPATPPPAPASQRQASSKTGGVVPGVPTTFSSKVTSSTSSSGQFVVHGHELRTRSLFSSRCDEVAGRLRQLLRDDEPWVLPVVVVLKAPPEANLAGPAVSTSISQIAYGGFHLQITVQLRPDLRPADLDAELMRILLAERILRNQKEITSKRSRILPEWLLTGVTQAMTFRDRSRPSAVFAAVFRSGKIYGIEEILGASPGELDALSRTIYETSCCALVLALLDQPEGPMRFRKFLGSLATDSREDRDLLNVCFPNLALSSSSLNKWWSLQMASLATPGVFEAIGPTETKKELDAALMIRYETAPDEAPRRTSRIVESTEPPAESNRQALSTRTSVSTPPGKDNRKAQDEKAAAASPTAGRKSEVSKPAAAKVEPPPAPITVATATKTRAEPQATASVPEASPEGEPRRRGLFSRMFARDGRNQEAKPEGADEQAGKKSESAKPDEPPPAKPEPPPASTRSDRRQQPRAADQAESKTNVSGNSAAAPKPGRTDEKAGPDSTAAPAGKTETEATRPAEPRKRGLFYRLFGGGDDEPKAGKEDATAPAEPKTEPEKTPNPGSKSEEPTRSGTPGETKKETAAHEGNDWNGLMASVATWWVDSRSEGPGVSGILLVDAIDYLAIRGFDAGGREAILGFGKKKKTEEQPSAEPKKEGKSSEQAGAPAAQASAAKKDEKAAGQASAQPSTRRSSRTSKKTQPEPESKPATGQPRPSSPAPAAPRTVSVSIPIEDYAHVMKRKDRLAILGRNGKALATLLPRANVLFRPIIQDYVAVIADLQSGRTKGVDERLAALRSRTAKAYQQAKAVQDHLDWFEASETKNYSGTFDDYLDLPAQIEKELPARNDPLSQYLDAMDAEFAK